MTGARRVLLLARFHRRILRAKICKKVFLGIYLAALIRRFLNTTQDSGNLIQSRGSIHRDVLDSIMRPI